MMIQATRQRGSVLIISLVILLVMTIIGLSSMESTILEERMAGNARDQDLAFQAAEAALRDGETDIIANIEPETLFWTDCTSARCEPAATGLDVWEDSSKIDWDGVVNVVEYGDNTGNVSLVGLSSPPAYVMERLVVVSPSDSATTGAGYGSTPKPKWYRLTARGKGLTTTAEAMVQSVFRK